MASGIITQGTVVNIEAGTLGCIQSFSQTTPAKTEIDTTCLTDSVKTFKFGIKDSASISFELLYDPSSTGQAAALVSYNDGTTASFEIIYNDSLGISGTTQTFDGYVISLSQEVSMDEVIRQTIEVKVDGEVTTVLAS